MFNVPATRAGFRIGIDGSADSGPPASPGAQTYGDPLRGPLLSARFYTSSLDPSAQQWAAVRPLPCAVAHRACLDSGRPAELCLRALYTCSQSGVPTIFAPGIWGAPS